MVFKNGHYYIGWHDNCYRHGYGKYFGGGKVFEGLFFKGKFMGPPKNIAIYSLFINDQEVA